MSYDITTHGDFKRYYDTTQKRNYWVLGYFGGGSVNLVSAMELGKQFAIETGVLIETVTIDEILHSRRHKGFKFISSQALGQKPHAQSVMMENVYQWLTD